MLLHRAVLRNSASLKHYYSSLAAAAEQKVPDAFRTNEHNPTNQSALHLGKYYRIDGQTKKLLFSHGGFPKSFEKQTKTFAENCLMVREPALEVMHYIKSSDLSKATVRYVLYGRDGVGKSLTLAHLIHFGHVNDFVLVHVPWVPNWYKKPKEKASSATHEGCFDLPIDAAAWLIHFKAQNAHLLAKLDLRCSKEYVWSKRESTSADATLLELIDHGIARIKFACDTIAVLLEELKQQSTQGKCKTMVAIDGYNSLFYTQTKIFAENQVKIAPHQITLTAPFKSITNYDWSNGVCVLVVDRMALHEGDMESELPRYLLGKDGFEHLDPFVPIHVDNYTDREFDSCIDYYLNRRWIQTTSDGFDKELKFLSGQNPYTLMQQCISL